jgi:hypothetical protein
MARYDMESFCDDLKTFLQANVNTKLAAMDTAKNDGITLSTIASGAYFFQTMGSEVANYNPLIYYGVSEATANVIQSDADRSFICDVVLIFSDDGNDPDIVRKMFRYQESLLQLFETNYAAISKLGTIKIHTVYPFSQIQTNSALKDWSVGVALEVHLP